MGHGNPLTTDGMMISENVKLFTKWPESAAIAGAPWL